MKSAETILPELCCSICRGGAKKARRLLAPAVVINTSAAGRRSGISGLFLHHSKHGQRCRAALINQTQLLSLQV
jgi:hypothetical protein